MLLFERQVDTAMVMLFMRMIHKTGSRHLQNMPLCVCVFGIAADDVSSDHDGFRRL